MPAMPSIAIIGASTNRAKFGNKCIRAYLQQGWTVHPVNPRAEIIEELPAYATILDVPAPVDRISLYLPPALGTEALADIARVEHNELFVNPGAESPELMEQARALGLRPVQTCAIVEVGVSPSTL